MKRIIRKHNVQFVSFRKASMVEVVYVEFQEITVELRAGPIRGSFPETIETFITKGTRDSRTSSVVSPALEI